MKNSVSAGAVVMHKKTKKVVVVNQNGTSWSLPKGHLEEGEKALDAVKREMYEEAGVKESKFIKKLGEYERYKIGIDGGEDTTEKKTIVMFLFETDQDDLKPIDPKNPEARWVKKKEVIQLLTHEKDKKFFSEFLENETNK